MAFFDFTSAQRGISQVCTGRFGRMEIYFEEELDFFKDGNLKKVELNIKYLLIFSTSILSALLFMLRRIIGLRSPHLT